MRAGLDRRGKSEVAPASEAGVPADYKPDEGLKRIAVAEAAEKHYARAKDPAKLYEAIEAKLGEQRVFIIWLDETFHSGEPKRGGNRQFADLQIEGIPDSSVLHRWRIKLKDPAKFDAALEAARTRCVKVAEFRRGATEQKGASGTGVNEWYTPPEYLDAARGVLGMIDLDPASSDAAQKRVKAVKYFTATDNGLAQKWHGRVWLNPPYAQPYIAEFVSKMVAEYRAGRVKAAIMLTHNYSDTAWFHEAAGIADAMCFTRGRIKFEDAAGNVAAPTQGQWFFYFGDDVAVFAQRFMGIGHIVTTYHGEV